MTCPKFYTWWDPRPNSDPSVSKAHALPTMPRGLPRYEYWTLNIFATRLDFLGTVRSDGSPRPTWRGIPFFHWGGPSTGLWSCSNRVNVATQLELVRDNLERIQRKNGHWRPQVKLYRALTWVVYAVLSTLQRCVLEKSYHISPGSVELREVVNSQKEGSFPTPLLLPCATLTTIHSMLTE